MTEEQARLDELIEERGDLDAAIEQARLLVTDEETPAPEVVEPVVAEAPTTQTALLAQIARLESEGKWAEVKPLKAALVASQSAFGGLSQPAPAPAAALPTLADLTKQIDEAEDSKNWAASSALKSQIVQKRFV